MSRSLLQAVCVLIAATLPAFMVVAVTVPQDEPSTSGETQADEENSQPSAEPSSLDELLGIEEDESNDIAADTADQEAREELDRRLSDEAVRDRFTAALEKMSLSADLLDREFDCGLAAQRVQQEILAKLDELIDEARKRCGGGSSSSSSSRRQDQEPGRRPSGQDRPAGASGGATGAGAEPPLQQDELNPVMRESRSEWGHLPQRVRDVLLQGRGEMFSSLYEQLTREYYQRLAEEGSS